MRSSKRGRETVQKGGDEIQASLVSNGSLGKSRCRQEWVEKYTGGRGVSNKVHAWWVRNSDLV